MYISKLFIRNFRKFSNTGTTFYFQKDINIIIGENNSGKSALVDALRLVLTSGLYRKNLYISDLDFHIDSCGEQATEIQIDIYFDDLSEEQASTFLLLTNGIDAKGEIHVKYNLYKDPKGNIKIRDSIFGGPRNNPLDRELFENIKLIFMRALRNAEIDFKPSRTSHLAKLLSVFAVNQDERDRILDALQQANETIKGDTVIESLQGTINSNLNLIEKEELQQEVEINLLNPTFDSVASALDTSFIIKHNKIRMPKAEWDEIIERNGIRPDGLQSSFILNNENIIIDYDKLMQLEVPGEFKCEITAKRKKSFQILSQNGLGYNNILSMAAVLGDLQQPKEDEYSVLIVEEPEAHLHPQLLDLLFNFFRNANHDNKFQVFLTSHSPTLVSKAEIKNLNIIYEHDNEVYSSAIEKCGLDANEANDIKRYLDVTKSQLFFAKRVLFVEGISEALLLVEFAKILGTPLDKYSIEIVNIEGVSFGPFAKLFQSSRNEHCLKNYCCIITDDDRCTRSEDPNKIKNEELVFSSLDVHSIDSRLSNGQISSRAENLNGFKGPNIEVKLAFKTLEFELAVIEENRNLILETLRLLHPNNCSAIERLIETGATKELIAIYIWVAIRDSKGIFAQLLARRISNLKNEEQFIVPDYIKESIEYVIGRR